MSLKNIFNQSLPYDKVSTANWNNIVIGGGGGGSLTITEGTNINFDINDQDYTINVVNNPTFTGDVLMSNNLNVTGSTTLGTCEIETLSIGGKLIPNPNTADTYLNYNGTNIEWIPVAGGGGVDNITAGTNINITGTATEPIINLDENITITGDLGANTINTNTLVIDNITFPTPTVTDTFLNYNGTNMVWSAVTEAGTITQGNNINVVQTGNNFEISVVNDPTFTGSVDINSNLSVAGILDTENFVLATIPLEVPTAADTFLSYNGTGMIWTQIYENGVQTVTGTEFQINATGTTDITLSLPNEIRCPNKLTANILEITSTPNNENPVILPILLDGSYPPNGYIIASNGTGGTEFIENTNNGIQSVTGTTNQIDVTGTTDITLSLPTEVIIGNITLNSSSNQIQTNANPVSGGINSGDHVKSSTFISTDLFITSKITTGGVYPSYKLPEIADDQPVGTNLIMKTNTADSNDSNSLNFVTLASIISNGQDIVATETMTNIAQLNINATGRGTNKILKTDAIDGSTLVWADSSGSSGVQSVSGAANQIAINDTDPANPIVFLPNIINAPGSFSCQQLTLDDTNGDSIFTFPLTAPSENQLIVSDINANSSFQNLATIITPNTDISATSNADGTCILNINANSRLPNYVLSVNSTNTGLDWINMGSGIHSQTMYQLINNTQVGANITEFNIGMVFTLWSNNQKTIQLYFAQNYTTTNTYAPIQMGTGSASGFYPQFADTPGTYPSCLSYLSGDNVSFTDFPSVYGVQSPGSILIGGSSIVLNSSIQIGVLPMFKLNGSPSHIGYCQISMTQFGILIDFIENNTSFSTLSVPGGDKIGLGYLNGQPATLSYTYY